MNEPLARAVLPYLPTPLTPYPPNHPTAFTPLHPPHPPPPHPPCAAGALRHTQAYHDARVYPQGVRSPQTPVQRAQVRRLLMTPSPTARARASVLLQQRGLSAPGQTSSQTSGQLSVDQEQQQQLMQQQPKLKLGSPAPGMASHPAAVSNKSGTVAVMASDAAAQSAAASVAASMGPGTPMKPPQLPRSLGRYGTTGALGLGGGTAPSAAGSTSSSGSSFLTGMSHSLREGRWVTEQ